MNPKRLDKLTKIAKITFRDMKGCIEDWKDPVIKGHIKRKMYAGVFDFSSTGLKTGYATHPYDGGGLGKWRTDKTSDHVYSPEGVGEFIMDNPDPYLMDFDKFFELFRMCCMTIEVLKVDNTRLSKLKGKVLTENKYQHLGINTLYKINEDNQVADFTDVILVPQAYTDYEKEKYNIW